MSLEQVLKQKAELEAEHQRSMYERTEDMLVVNLIHNIVNSQVLSGPHNDPGAVLHYIYGHYYTNDLFKETLKKFAQVLLTLFPNPEPIEKEPI